MQSESDLVAHGGTESSMKNAFPLGMRVLAVDDDRACLRMLETLLGQCGYRVTAVQHAMAALELLRGNKGYYDLVITDVEMPDMDGFQLLEIIGLEMDLPVIMLSINSETSYVMKGVLHGAVDYLVKPVRIEELKLIWKHVIRKALSDKKGSNELIDNNNDIKAHKDECLRISNPCINEVNKGEDCAHEIAKHKRRVSGGEIAKHKRRVSWSTDLHLRFIAAVRTLGVDRALPKKILELMNVEGLTRENVASHLQKYRKTLERNDGCHFNGLSVDSSSSVFSSFCQQAHAKKSSCKKFRLGEYQEDKVIASSDPPHTSFGSSVSSPYRQFASHSQANLRPEYLWFPSDFSSPELTYESSRLDVFSYPSLTSTSDPVDICPTTQTSTGNQDLNSYSQFHCPSNQFSVWTSLYNNIELNDSAHLNTELLYIFLGCIVADIGIATVAGGDIVDMQMFGEVNFNYTYHLESTKNQSEDSPTEMLFHLDRCSSEDDLNTILKQV
ncbi:hypothetical protein ZIOFF_056907 [Zingiber officinale]|uniref:Two-component response regulator n=1 Tax=Zingiber officinale TaxID=94328 RepID=A0A8J5KLA8_ZINOF|nr:hypothetical protein ZIOFF_056907 [Zingiber officinale]